MINMTLHQALSALHATAADGDGAFVHTHCIYPSQVQVRVRVQPLANGEFLVSDDAAGLGEILSMGVETQRPGYYLAEQAGRHGVRYHRGEISVVVNSIEKLSAAVILVANASKDGVLRTALAHEASNQPSFDFVFESFVRDRYTGKFRPETINGASGAARRFRYVHQRGNADGLNFDQKIVLVEPVSPTQMAIAVKVQAHRDIIHRNLPDLWQCLVVDKDTDSWTRRDIELLNQSGVRWMEFPQVEIELVRLVA